MKLYKRFCCVLLVCVLLSVLFSIQVGADSDPSSFLTYRFSIMDDDYNYSFNSDVIPFSDQFNIASRSYNFDLNSKYLCFEFKNNDAWYGGNKIKIFNKGDTFSLDINSFSSVVDNFDIYKLHKSTWDGIKIQVYDYSNNLKTYNGSVSLSKDLLGLLSIQGITSDKEMPFDVYKFRVLLPFSFSDYEGYGDVYASLTDEILAEGIDENDRLFNIFSVITEEGSSPFTIHTTSEEKSLLKSILDFIKQIKITITNVYNSIIEFPEKLWLLISNGLKSLFVPSEDYFVDYKDKWDTLLSSRFGALYEIGGLVVDLGQNMLSYMESGDVTSYIDFPLIEFNLPDGNVWSFGGWRVHLYVPGFDLVYSGIYTVGLVCGILLFIHGLRKRYDEVMGVEQ